MDSALSSAADWDFLKQLPYAFGRPPAEGAIRSCPEDFRVDEIPLGEPDGEGEHVLLQIEKRNSNTEWVARQLARVAGVPPRDVGFAGLKDRHGVTTQWFSVGLAGRAEPDWRRLESEALRILQTGRHRRKLRRGMLTGNRFRIRVRGYSGSRDELGSRMAAMASEGVPNYFGRQRFGRDYGNLGQAGALFERRGGKVDRHRRGLYLSAARSLLFNRVLARRVEAGNWNRPLAGDSIIVEGREERIRMEEEDREIRTLAEEQRAHPTGPMWGRGRSSVTGLAAKLEQEALAGLARWRDGLEHVGLSQERRALRSVVRELEWALLSGGVLELSFRLSPGCYATAVLRELCRLEGDQAS